MNEDQQRSIKSSINKKRKRPKNLNSFGTVYAVYSPKKLIINPTERTAPNLPDRMHAVLTIMPTVLNLELKNGSDTELIKNIHCSI